MYFNEYVTETHKINKLVNIQGGVTDVKYVNLLYRKWLMSSERKKQIEAYDYLNGKMPIDNRERKVIGANGLLEVVNNLPNNKIKDNQYLKMVDQKTNYLFSKPFSVDIEDIEHNDILNKIFTKRFYRDFYNLGRNAITYGLGFLYIYIDNNSNIKIKNFKPYECYPVWEDDDHTELSHLLRVYDTTVINDDMSEKIQTYAEFYTLDFMLKLKLESDKFILLETTPYIHDTKKIINMIGIPVIPFKNGIECGTLLSKVKVLQDSLNIVMSDFMNNSQEDARNTILVLKNYDGENLGDFRQNLSQYGAIKVRSFGDDKCGVDTLKIDINTENYNTLINLLKRAIIENARGYDCKDDRLSSNPNQLNIRSMYSDIDLDANGLEAEFQCSLVLLLDYIDLFVNILYGIKLDGKVDIIFNKDQLLNESEVITDIQNSVGIISNKSIIGHHPYVKDVNAELEQIKKENNEMEYFNHFNENNEV